MQEVTSLNQTTIDTSVYRKNLQTVVYVTGDVAGEEESPVYAIGKMSDAIEKIKRSSSRTATGSSSTRARPYLSARTSTP